eukprot:TRINITY_DN3797_c0_g1_i1.p1 TRINITY_DN3797_c0_g1~~TRINITY_DN3797_c0_g1_i1.p1  ORF type:complete len:158 (-),score=38.73 TRINITY_DN3797_c0_g1_i1:283-756(-)
MLHRIATRQISLLTTRRGVIGLSSRYYTTTASSSPSQILSSRRLDDNILLKSELEKIISSSPHEYVIVDVRNPQEVEQTGLIATANTIPLYELSEALNLDAVSFKDKYGFSKFKPDDKIIYYCKSGVRSAQACALTKANGFTNVINYKGSAKEWFGL